MKMYLYNTDSTNNTINKVLTDQTEFDIAFKGEADTITPTVQLTVPGLLNFNYAYIPEFERYYFIKNVSMRHNQLIVLDLEVDVLESYKEDILKANVIVSRHSGANKYYDGGDYRVEERKTHTIFKSDVTPEFKENLVLVTIGG